MANVMMEDGTPSDIELEPLDVLDLPQLYQRPTAAVLLSILSDLTIEPPSWNSATPAPKHRGRQKRKVNSEGIPAYLTNIIASPLTWLGSDTEREQIWETASRRLAERSGRTGMGALERSFAIPPATPSGNAEMPEEVAITLHEPALTGDNLGLKTWGAAYLLAKRLATFRTNGLLPSLQDPHGEVLELGSGTGLVGLAAAAVFQRQVTLTDLPDIVPNLQRNTDANAVLLSVQPKATVLDWTYPTDFPRPAHSFPLILSADPIYSPEHPRLFVQTVEAHLSKTEDARVVVELPLREHYVQERQDLAERLKTLGLVVLSEGVETGLDDWGGGELEVECGWSVWGWRQKG